MFEPVDGGDPSPLVVAVGGGVPSPLEEQETTTVSTLSKSVLDKAFRTFIEHDLAARCGQWGNARFRKPLRSNYFRCKEMEKN